GESYETLALRQYERPIGQTWNRGSIYFTDRDGKRVSAATLQDGFPLVVNPTKIKNLESTYATLTEIITLDRANFFARAKKTNDPHEEIASRLTVEEGKAINARKLPGVVITPQKWRFYPGKTLASHLLGFVGYQGDQYSGRYGLEKYYENILRRGEDSSGASFFEQIFSGLMTSTSAESEAGEIVTTVEPSVQRFLERELESINADWQPKVTGGIILDPKTGAVLALGALPTFEPGGKRLNLEHLANPLIERVYEMGSVVKPLTMAAGLDAGVVAPTTTYDDRGVVVLDDREIGNYDRRGRGIVSMQEVLNQSLNTGAIYVMQKLGGERFEKYFQNFGLLGEKTGIDLPGELNGLANNLNSRRAVEYATASFGQGIALTPLAITTALSSLA
ncbi:MAG: penicillin-binding transpeptidase domain-containing protein, partial [archaeon]